MKELHLDFETYSDIDLTQVGVQVYTNHPSFEVLMAAWAVDDGPEHIWLPHEDTPQELYEALEDTECAVFAHNAEFEIGCINNHLAFSAGWPIPSLERYRCTAALAASLGLPRSLEMVAITLGLTEKKMDEGKKLIQHFCKPRKPTQDGKYKSFRCLPEEDPVKFEQFQEYCIQDVRTERAVHQRLKGYLKYMQNKTPIEMDIYHLTAKMNARGLPVDSETAKIARSVMKQYSGEQIKIFQGLTGGLNPSQRDKVLGWVQQNGADIPNLQAGTIDAVLSKECGLPKDVHQALEIRRSLGRSSVKKLVPMIKLSKENGRVCDTLMYCGAHTGRWTAKLLQPHNFVRPTIKDAEGALQVLLSGDMDFIKGFYTDPAEVVSSCLRPMLWAEEGKILCVGDYKAIEARMVCWLAGQEDVLELYRKDLDAYVDMIAFLLKKDPKEVTGDERALGKAIVLGCGFQMSAPTFKDTCDKDGINITMAMAEKGVSGYRSKYDMVRKYWFSIDDAFKYVVRTKQKKVVNNVSIFWVEDFVVIRLPSGRRLHYYKPRLKKNGSRTNIIYTGKADKGRHGDIYTYGGKLVENITQAAARDIMAEAMVRCENNGYEMLFTVHDELVSQRPADDYSQQEFEDLLCEKPKWGQDIPITVETYFQRRYKK